MTFFGSDNLQVIKAALPFKVVAVGRFSELECALQSCHESVHGCDFEKKDVLTLKVIEDGSCVLGTAPDVVSAQALCPLSPLLMHYRNQGQEVKVEMWR